MSKQPQEMEANSQEVLLENHIHNKHDGHSEDIPSCKHKELCTCQLHAPLPHLRDRVGDSRGLDIVKLTNSPPLGHFLGANLLPLPLLPQRG